jgi:hypothetical protein
VNIASIRSILFGTALCVAAGGRVYAYTFYFGIVAEGRAHR